MAGSLRGSISHYYAGDIRQNAGTFFKIVYDYFCSMTGSASASLIALQTGSDGTGTGFPYDTDPFGQNAFAVFRMERPTSGKLPYYALIQWTAAAAVGTAPGDPATSQTTTYSVYFAAAYNTDSVTPWNGTTLANGNDRKNASDVWISSGENTLCVYPFKNSVWSTSKSKKEYVGKVATLNSNPIKVHVLGDEDAMLIVCANGSGETAYTEFFYFGDYLTLSGSRISNPLFGFYDTVTPAIDSLPQYYDGSGREGGIIDEELGISGTLSFTFNYAFNDAQSTTYSPNQALSSSRYDEMPYAINVTGPLKVGMAGYTKHFRNVYNLPQHATNVSKTRMIVGSGTPITTGALRMSIPWDGVTDVSYAMNPSGTQFINT